MPLKMRKVQARPGRPSSTTGCTWHCGCNLTTWPLHRLRSGLPPGCRSSSPPSASWICPAGLRKLDNFDFLLLDDLGYLPQGLEESEVLFTLIAERYERRSLGITSNLVFSEWERIFANPMASAAVIDRVVHHSVILEFDVPSYRTDAAQQRGHAEEVNRQN